MKKFFESICDTFRLILAALLTLLAFIVILYIFPSHSIVNILPDYLIETTQGLTTTQKKVIDQLYLNGKLTDPKGLYGEIIEYYHFLVFLVFALLALVGGFVYLQIRSETSAKINKAVKDGIQEADIEAKVHEKIEEIEIDKIITEQIDEEALAERISADVIDTTIAEVQIGFDGEIRADAEKSEAGANLPLPIS